MTPMSISPCLLQKTIQCIFKWHRSSHIVSLEACRKAFPSDFRGIALHHARTCLMAMGLPMTSPLAKSCAADTSLSSRSHQSALRLHFRPAPHPLENLVVSLSRQCQRQCYTNNPGSLSEQTLPKSLWHIQYII